MHAYGIHKSVALNTMEAPGVFQQFRFPGESPRPCFGVHMPFNQCSLDKPGFFPFREGPWIEEFAYPSAVRPQSSPLWCLGTKAAHPESSSESLAQSLISRPIYILTVLGRYFRQKGR